MAFGRHVFRVFGQSSPTPRLALVSFVLAALGSATVALEHGFDDAPLPGWLSSVLQFTLPWLALFAAGDVAWGLRPSVRYRRPLGWIGEGLILIAGTALAAGVTHADSALAIAAGVAAAIRLNGVLARSMSRPGALFPLSFLALIAVSTSLLMLPAATPADQRIRWIDAVFTSTSAVCVTGLSVRDTATGFTMFGQGVILASIQLGGLGIMIFGSTLALLFGARLSYRENVTLSMALDEYPAHRIARFTGFIVLTTVLLEAIGAAILYVSWPQLAEGPGGRAWGAIFHSVSAFCNAGFDITGQSLIGVRAHPAPYLGIMPMIVLGGLGFIVLEDVYRTTRDRIRGKRLDWRLTTHARLTLLTTGALLFAGFAVILLAQSMAGGSISGQRVLDAAFMSTTARTAGFTTVPMEELTSGSRLMIMMLMTVGGSPGSTAGGIKTVVFAVLVLAVISTVRGRDEVEVFGRALPDALVKKASTVAAGLFGVVAVSTLTLDLTERIPFEPLFFEVISAATTTGLSLGATSELSPAGRIIITVTMFMGRVGALALLASLIGSAGRGGRYRLPRDTVSLG